MIQTTPKHFPALLKTCLYSQADPNSNAWLAARLSDIGSALEVRLFATFSLISRYFGQERLQVSSSTNEVAQVFAPDRDLSDWTLAQAARTLFLLTLANKRSTEFQALLAKLLNSADTQESIAIYQCAALLPNPQSLAAQLQEGLRSNISSVFNAIALNNPYPAYYFNEAAWNQMILKAIFIESDLSKIIGLNRRTNSALSLMLLDYAKERQAANRSVLPLLWHMVGLGADTEVKQYLRALTESENLVLQQGA